LAALKKAAMFASEVSGRRLSIVPRIIPFFPLFASTISRICVSIFSGVPWETTFIISTNPLKASLSPHSVLASFKSKTPTAGGEHVSNNQRQLRTPIITMPRIRYGQLHFPSCSDFEFIGQSSLI
jgi:hypothetical protein